MTKLGSSVVRFDSVTSTNEVARGIAGSGGSEGLAIIAGEQTAGRGSKGRSWASPAGEGLYLSLVLRPDIKVSESTVLTLAAAVGVTETIIQEFNAAADIKWPNDVMVNGRKVCGILVESASEGERLQYAILGIGINLAQRRFPPEIAESATSLLLETGRETKPDDFLAPLLERLDWWYRLALKTPSEVVARYEQLSSYARGCYVRVGQLKREGADIAEEEFEGVTRGLTLGGALLVETAPGTTRVIVSAEVRSIRSDAR